MNHKKTQVLPKKWIYQSKPVTEIFRVIKGGT